MKKGQVYSTLLCSFNNLSSVRESAVPAKYLELKNEKSK